nr:hypothetical protein [Noviherbaspirillum cavernae]
MQEGPETDVSDLVPQSVVTTNAAITRLAIGLVQGERFNKTIVDSLRFARDFNERFPGFETDVHGLVTQEKNGRRGYYVDCVK